MKKKMLPRLIKVVIIFSLMIEIASCSFAAKKEPINKEGAVFTLEEVQINGWGSGAANQDSNLTAEKMLRYALEDEYIKRTRYELISEKFKIEEPFYSMSKSETCSILKLLTLFSKYNVPVPADKSLEYIKTPKNLLEGYNLSIKGEENNAAMYDKFLRNDTLNDDIKLAFTKLRNISKENMEALCEEYKKLN
ncbi:hypothetical protein GOM49_15530 [Clostridium bovifaecis]|uniref:Uncharacterized protein n=1 Tax=Clostridium bovifaecis TaxID=2184719 RepID=A0A6I6F7L4_9CLOT|nr:hypothetical protein GOM49_15530 [Clostridium bovifaecis]